MSEKESTGVKEVTKTEKVAKTATFKEFLEAKQVKVGDTISFEVDENESTIIVDQDFLNLPINDDEFYKKFKYKVK